MQQFFSKNRHASNKNNFSSDRWSFKIFALKEKKGSFGCKVIEYFGEWRKKKFVSIFDWFWIFLRVPGAGRCLKYIKNA